MVVLQWLIIGIFLVGIPMGVLTAIKHNGTLKAEQRRLSPKEKRRRRRLPRDSHAQAFFDGMITDEALHELDDLFK